MSVYSRSMGLSVALFAIYVGPQCARAEDDLIETTVCDVVANPSNYDGKIIKVRAEGTAGRHTSGLSDRSCKGFILFWGPDSPRWRGQFACATGVPFESADDGTLRWHDALPKPQVVNFLRDQWWRVFEQALADRHPENRECMRQMVVATVVGRFNHEPCDLMWVRAKPTDAPVKVPTAYGPMATFHSSISIRSVENVVVGPVNQCWGESEKKVQDQPRPR